MKMIEAIIKPCKLGEVEDALLEMGIEDFMESTIICHGHQEKQALIYRGDEYLTDSVAKVKLEIIADDDSAEKIIEVIGTIAKTERTGDCRIFVLPFLEAC
jgi:nitrogen regulatory protein P-II 1